METSFRPTRVTKTGRRQAVPGRENGEPEGENAKQAAHAANGPTLAGAITTESELITALLKKP